MRGRDARVRRAFRPMLDRFETRLTPSGYDWFVPAPPSDLDAPEAPPAPADDPTLPEVPWDTIVVYPWGSEEPIPLVPQPQATPPTAGTPSENAIPVSTVL